MLEIAVNGKAEPFADDRMSIARILERKEVKSPETEGRIHGYDCNLAESWREISRWNPHTDMIEKEDMLLIAGADPYPAANVAMRVGFSRRSSPESFIKRAREFFLARDRHFTLLLRQHRDADLIGQCQALNLHRISAAPGMVINHPPELRTVPQAVTVKPIGDLEGVRDFARVFAASFATLGMPVEVARRMLCDYQALLRPYLLLFVAYRGKTPSSCALVLLSHGIGGIYCVGTIAEARGQGLGECCIRNAVSAAFASGARSVVLQATEYGRTLYQRLGFQEYSNYPWYICPFRELKRK
jgi:ribosomal protein S18 acetylase RimI-like enzyme